MAQQIPIPSGRASGGISARSILASRFFVSLMLFVVMAGLATELYLRRLHRAETENIWQAAEASSQLAAMHVRRNYEALNAVATIIRLYLLSDDSTQHREARDALLRHSLDRSPFGGAVAVITDPAGIVLWSNGVAAVGEDISSRPELQMVQGAGAPDLAVGRLSRNEANGMWEMTAAGRISAGERIQGYFLAEGRPQLLSATLVELARASDENAHEINIRWLSDGRVRASSNPDRIGEGMGDPATDEVLIAARIRDHGQITRLRGTDGREAMTYFVSLWDLGFVAQVDIDPKRAFAHFVRDSFLMHGAWILLAIAAAGVGYGWSRASLLRDVHAGLAQVDHLTGLLNRRALRSGIRARLRRDAPGRSVACLLLDLDHFKAVNDTYGHAAGDAVLRRIAGVIGRTVRDADLVCRWGGEEIMVVMFGCAHGAALQRAEEIRCAIERCPGEAGGAGPVTVSIGVAMMPDDASNLDDLFAAADLALYRAKEMGRNRVETVWTARANLRVNA